MQGATRKGCRPMSDPAITEGKPHQKRRLPLILGVVAMLLAAGTGFYAVWSGLILAPHETASDPAAPLPDIGFVPVPPVVISLPPGSTSEHLRFASQLEVNGPHTAEVTLLLPRIQDVLNGYLRAVKVSDLQDPAALVRIRAQLLRRVQLVAGDGRVRDLLVTEFVLN